MSFALVTVRTDSSRLPKKCFLKIDQDACLIEVVIRRAKLMNCQVVLCTSDHSNDDDLVKIAKNEKIEYFKVNK